MNYLPGLGSSDNVLMRLDFNYFIDATKGSCTKVNFHKGDYISMNQALLDIQWNTVLGGLSLWESWDCFAEKINNFIRTTNFNIFMLYFISKSFTRANLQTFVNNDTVLFVERLLPW